jgi:2',3'-cyclic-nucleotide 2'-phosphodiesterase/3'-nucleotidase
MKIKSIVLLPIRLILLALLVSCSGGSEKSITILETTDLHGAILPYDFIEKEDIKTSLANSATYFRQLRNSKNPVILLDNGDNLQGQPGVYYYNFIDTISPHFSSEVMNYLGYDAGTVGNHDIEAGHSVYDRLIKEYNFPLLAANAVDVKTGKPYFKPYQIIERGGVKVVVFGLITPAVPNWLPQELYYGIEFKEMVETAKLWMPVISDEKPDLVVGLFHSGWDKTGYEDLRSGVLKENESSSVAYFVPGFDIIFTGHDHKKANEKFINSVGDTVLILNGGSRSENIAEARITFSSKKINGKRIKSISGKILDVSDFNPDAEFISKFSQQNKILLDYVNKVIGYSTSTISSRDSYFGSSAFVDMIHSIQLDITGADISFAAPLSFDVKISEGPISVGDMFKLYRFENMLYSMKMTGEEIHNYLEYSYGGWVSTLAGPNDMLLQLRKGKDGKAIITNGKAWLQNQPYNFDSASGIEYTVDVSKPEGKRISVKSFSDGRAFEKSSFYKVALNSYRGNGGGGHLTTGAGIAKDMLRTRLISSTERDLRFYILKFIENQKTIEPRPLDNWKIIPENWMKVAIPREYTLLFGTTK